MHIIYLYDVDGWALHNIGLLLQPVFEGIGEQFTLLPISEYRRTPIACDILYLSYSGLLLPSDDFRHFARDVICTIHDPLEISHFTDRFEWRAEPLRRVDFSHYDRISATTHDMFTALRDGYRAPPLYRTPTFPHDVEAIRAAILPRSSTEPIRFFAATIAWPYISWGRVVRRLARIREYLQDSYGSWSWRQLRSLVIRVNRKNIPLLERISAALAGRRGVEVNFLRARSVTLTLPRDEYLKLLTNADVYVCTSFVEGGPLPVMEAVIAGAAVLTTRVGQVEDWVLHGENGFVCHSYDDFMRCIEAYLSDPQLLREHQARSAMIGRAVRFDSRPWLEFVLGQAPSLDDGKYESRTRRGES